MAIADPLFPASEHAAGAPPPGLLDVADGVARLLGDRVLFGRILQRFRDDYADGAIAIGAAVDSGDTRLAHRLAHTLTGAAGMIGARALHQHAYALELALSQGDSAHGALDAVAAALACVLAAIDQLLESEAAPVPPPAATGARPGRALVAQLAGLLENGDGAAIDLLEQSAASLAATLGAARLRAVATAANEFDFDGALAALRTRWDGDGAGDG
jgi:HPt (histidine-containing phosphotransfer) domain-containing protein